MNKQFTSWLTKVSAVAMTLFTTGCAEYYIDKLDSVQTDGYPFAKALKSEYEAYAKVESRTNYDQIDASSFAIKGLQAAHGLEVLPEDPRMWDVPAEKLPMLLEARDRLLFAIHKSGAVIAPEIAAKAQVSYDCWVNQTEEQSNSSEMAQCEMAFKQYLMELEKAVEKYAPTFSVYFDFNSPVVRKDAHPVLDRVAKVAMNMASHTVFVTGHTDGIGGRKFNLKLSQHRAENVRNELVKMGVPANRINFVGAGELGSKEIEPKHRRVDIEIG